MTTTAPDVWAIITAIATSASAIVIAIQAIYTRKSVQQAKRSSDASERSADAANEAVNAAQAALRQNRIANIDAGVPRVIVKSTRKRPGYFERIHPDNMSIGHLKPVTLGDDFYRLPQDADRVVAVELEVRIRNDGPQTVQLRFSPRLSSLDVGEWFTGVATLTSGESLVGLFHVEKTVAQWVEIAERGERGLGWWESVLRITHQGPRDAEAVETIAVRVHGSLFERAKNGIPPGRVTSEEDAWVIGFLNGFNTDVLPATREYWESIAEQKRFPV